MATSKETVAYVLEQLEPLNVRARAMFGEYGVYCDEKIVLLMCDDTVFIKPTKASDGMPEAPAYPGAKNSRVADAALIADSERFRALVQQTADALPAAKPKKSKTP
jgi:TfoX/Sxy family transcriptional regulator of competence genes